MAMVGVASGSLQVDSQPESFGLVWGSAAAWRCSTFIIWIGWTLAVALSYDDSTINIVVVIIVIIVVVVVVVEILRFKNFGVTALTFRGHVRS